MKQEQVITKEHQRAFFIQLPGFIDYLDLSVWEMRLYTHYVRVCGDSGECFEYTSTTADMCRMSTSQLKRARNGLRDTGLIQCEERGEPGSTRVHVKVLDRWELNALFLGRMEQFGRDDMDGIDTWLRWHLQHYAEYFGAAVPPQVAAPDAPSTQSGWLAEVAYRDQARNPGSVRTPPGSDRTPPRSEGPPPGSDRTPPHSDRTPPGSTRTPPGSEGTAPRADRPPPGFSQNHKERSNEEDPFRSDPSRSDPTNSDPHNHLDDDDGSGTPLPTGVQENCATIHQVARARRGVEPPPLHALRALCQEIVADMGPNAWPGFAQFLQELDGAGTVRLAAWLWLWDVVHRSTSKWSEPAWVQHYERHYAAHDPFRGVASVPGKIITQVRYGHLPDLVLADWQELNDVLEKQLVS